MQYFRAVAIGGSIRARALFGSWRAAGLHAGKTARGRAMMPAQWSWKAFSARLPVRALSLATCARMPVLEACCAAGTRAIYLASNASPLRHRDTTHLPSAISSPDRTRARGDLLQGAGCVSTGSSFHFLLVSSTQSRSADPNPWLASSLQPFCRASDLLFGCDSAQRFTWHSCFFLRRAFLPSSSAYYSSYLITYKRAPTPSSGSAN